MAGLVRARAATSAAAWRLLCVTLLRVCRGHASEVPDLPRSLAAAGIVFLGPRADAMAALGDKVASSILAQSAGVPTLPWSGSGVTLDVPVDAAGGVPVIPEAVYSAACVDSEAAAVASCNEIGYPVMIKARELSLPLAACCSELSLQA